MIDFPIVKAGKKSLSGRRLIHGAGINDSLYMTGLKIDGKRVTCPIYSVWKGIIQRCFDAKLHERYPTYSNCSVANEWIKFSGFHEWTSDQNFKGLEIDKDIIKPGNKHYCPELCFFADPKVNRLLTDNGRRRGELPIGVYLNRPLNKYHAQISVNSKRLNLGFYDTPEEASKAYRLAKHDHVVKIAFQQSDLRVKKGLLLHAELILTGKKP